ncbi:MAG: PH domain-containing protein [Longimicrobiales bacterium]
MNWRKKLLDLLRVPAEPSAPDGDQDIQVFRAAPNYFWYRVLHWAIKNAFAALGLMMAVGSASAILPAVLPDEFWGMSKPAMLLIFNVIELSAVAGFIGQAIGTFLLLRLDFEQRWYIVTDRSLRIREGLVRLREQTVTFANVQNVAIRQGPIQRLLGIAELQVRTAGGGKASEWEEGQHSESDLHLARFRGIANPEVVCAAIRDRLRQHRDAGLGDPDDHSPEPQLLQAAAELAQQARGLRLAIAVKQ